MSKKKLKCRVKKLKKRVKKLEDAMRQSLELSQRIVGLSHPLSHKMEKIKEHLDELNDCP